MELAVEMKGITKIFPGVIACDGVDFSLRKGEIHSLLGENGAGKTTLMNILYGLYKPESGSIFLNGKEVYLRSPRDAISFGIGMVHQHFTLVLPLTVVENIVMGTKYGSLNLVAGKIKELADRYGLNVDPWAYIWQLSMGERQRVEILKALYRDVDVLILDEPTTVLTFQETEELFSVLKKMKSEGKSVIFISHKLNEVMEISDRITVLRDGKVINTVNKADTSQKELAKMMVGREVVFRLQRPEVRIGGVVLELKDVSCLNDKGMVALKGVSFDIREGEIFGIAGVAGNGQSELAEVITGLRPLTGGSIRLLGEDLVGRTPREIREVGVSHVPEDRMDVGLILDMTVKENFVSDRFYKPPVSRSGFLNYSYMNELAKDLIQQYGIKTPGVDAVTRILSGGNLQKIVLARELSSNPRLIVAAQPTQGLDVGTTEYIRRLLLEEKSKGAAILLISEDLEEVLSLSDRIAVMYEGEIMGILDYDRANKDIELVGLMMAGAERLG